MTSVPAKFPPARRRLIPPPARRQLLLCMLALPGCDYLPGSASPSTFENPILRFEHPASWQADAGGASGGLQ